MAHLSWAMTRPTTQGEIHEAQPNYKLIPVRQYQPRHPALPRPVPLTDRSNGCGPHETFGRSSAGTEGGEVMDFSELRDAVASQSYTKIADICDSLMLRVAAEGVSFQDEWPYALHLLGYIYVDDINTARFLWKSIPAAIKESQPEIVAAWRIGQKLWTRDCAGVHEALRGFDWSQEARGLINSFSEIYTGKIFHLLSSAYSTICIQDTALFLGMTEDDATNYVLQQGWLVDPVTRVLTVKKLIVSKEQKLNPDKLQRLTEYVMHLEH